MKFLLACVGAFALILVGSLVVSAAPWLFVGVILTIGWMQYQKTH